jgi:hypothetical protein
LRVVHIAIAESACYFLTQDGRLFSAGDGDNGKLLMENRNSRKQPTQCELIAKLGAPVSWMSAGSSSVMVQIGAWRMLPHPILGVRPAGVPFLVNLPGRRGEEMVDIGYQAAAKMDLCFGEEVRIKGKDRPWRFVGVTMDGSAEFVDEDGLLHLEQVMPEREAVDPVATVKGRSLNTYILRKDAETLRPFGVYVGEEIVHLDLGTGIVRGAYGGHVFIEWDGEEGVSAAAPKSVLHMYRVIRVTNAIGRTVQNIEVGGITSLPVQIDPCPVLARYGFLVNDFVTAAEITGIVIGEFSVHAVVRDLLTEKASLVLPSQIELRRRMADGPVIVSRRYFDRSVREVDVSYLPDDELRPSDRVLSEKGFATVLGKCGRGLLVQLDSALRLNIGAVDYGGKCRLIRRIDRDSPRWSTFLPGDILADPDGVRYLLTYTDGNFFMESAGARRPVPTTAEGIRLVARADCHAERDAPILGAQAVFSVNMRDFRGLRVCPGDVTEVDGERYSVIGIRNAYIWMEPVEGGNPFVLAQQAFLDPDIVKIISRVDDMGIDL